MKLTLLIIYLSYITSLRSKDPELFELQVEFVKHNLSEEAEPEISKPYQIYIDKEIPISPSKLKLYLPGHVKDYFKSSVRNDSILNNLITKQLFSKEVIPLDLNAGDEIKPTEEKRLNLRYP
jgi:hypothetical protein